jgi:hypothetical protein
MDLEQEKKVIIVELNDLVQKLNHLNQTKDSVTQEIFKRQGMLDILNKIEANSKDEVKKSPIEEKKW